MWLTWTKANLEVEASSTSNINTPLFALNHTAAPENRKTTLLRLALKMYFRSRDRSHGLVRECSAVKVFLEHAAARGVTRFSLNKPANLVTGESAGSQFIRFLRWAPLIIAKFFRQLIQEISDTSTFFTRSPLPPPGNWEAKIFWSSRS